MDLSMTRIPSHSPMTIEAEKLEQRKIWRRLKWWKGEDQSPPPFTEFATEMEPEKPSLSRRLSKRVMPNLPLVNLPRPATFRRQNSERRERLMAVPCAPPRTVSVGRRRAASARPASPPLIAIPKMSAPAVCTVDHPDPCGFSGSNNYSSAQTTNQLQMPRPAPPPSPPPDLPPDSSPDHSPAMSETSFDDQLDEKIRTELEEKWILNLSMHFRDKSPREKFFVTFAETRVRWRRVTVSCDYRDSPPDSLERDLQALHYQRDKSSRIYEAIRMSLPDIQFYDTVTNLKLETSQDGRLHVHVTEDVNEIIPYPSISAVEHLPCKRIPETDVHFDSHMSGFVYKVQVNGHVYIKKEIPGPDSVEEFLYEINALHALMESQHVIHFHGLVTDERNGLIKGLLISYAEQGPLVDKIFDYKPNLEWARRERWAKQIVHGLSEIHEAGFVQGDFTLSNIVIDEHDKAQIIDINRRGCPVGWEPPEIAKLIESGQRISMYIGVKSDLFQLGMVLWALAEEEDEPERQPRPLSLKNTKKDVPEYYRQLTDRCLSKDPRDRLSATDLLKLFPTLPADGRSHHQYASLSPNHAHAHSIPSETHYIHPSAAVEREDLALHRNQHGSGEFSSPSHTYVDPPGSTEMTSDARASYIVTQRGRPPFTDTSRRPYPQHSRSRSISPPHSEPEQPQIVPISPGGGIEWDEVSVDGEPYLVHRENFEFEDEDESERLQHRLRSEQRRRDGTAEGRIPGMSHVDSGLADMDGLAGIGSHPDLAWEEGRGYSRELEMGDGKGDLGTVEEETVAASGESSRKVDGG